MLDLVLPATRRGTLEVLCIGAHCDDIEIGCGATLLRLASERKISVTWVILCSTATREAETRGAAGRFLRGTQRREVCFGAFEDGFLPARWAEAKAYFEALKNRSRPDLIFTHEEKDLHQDHRVACELTWNTFRDHLILEFEIPKYDGGLTQPNVYVPASRRIVSRKCSALHQAYASQRHKSWFDDATFRGVMRLRGLECNAPEGYAEAFRARKLRL